MNQSDSQSPLRFRPPKGNDPTTLGFVGGNEDTKRAESYLRWLISRASSLGTVRTYGYHLTDFLRFCEEQSLKLSEIVASHIVDYIRTRTISPRPPTARTLNGRLSAIRSLYRYLMLMEPDRFTSNPVEDAAPLRATRRQAPLHGMLGHLHRYRRDPPTLQLSVARRLPNALSPNEVAALMDSFRTMRDRAMALLMLMVGLRSCEVLSLRLDDVDFGRQTLRVLGKGNRERVVPVASQVLRVIDFYLKVERPPTFTENLFVVLKGKNRGEPLRPEGLRSVFRYHRKRANVFDAHPHSLRHTFASEMAKAGMKLEELKELLGHVYIDSTMVYVHLASDTVRESYLEALKQARKKRP